MAKRSWHRQRKALYLRRMVRQEVGRMMKSRERLLSRRLRSPSLEAVRSIDALKMRRDSRDQFIQANRSLRSRLGTLELQVVAEVNIDEMKDFSDELKDFSEQFGSISGEDETLISEVVDYIEKIQDAIQLEGFAKFLIDQSYGEAAGKVYIRLGDICAKEGKSVHAGIYFYKVADFQKKLEDRVNILKRAHALFVCAESAGWAARCAEEIFDHTLQFETAVHYLKRAIIFYDREVGQSNSAKALTARDRCLKSLECLSTHSLDGTAKFVGTPPKS